MHFETDELITKCLLALDKELRVTPLQYIVQRGEQKDGASYDDVKHGEAFGIKETETSSYNSSIHSTVKYDLVGKLAEDTLLTRRTIASILQGLNIAVFGQYKTNPEDFITQAARLINEQKATVIVEHIVMGS